MSAKDRKSKSKVSLLREVILFIRTDFETHLRVCVNANVCMLERTHEVIDCILPSVHDFPGQRC